MRKILKEPLIHFLILGACLFGAFELFGDKEPFDNPKIIVIQRSDLLTYLLYRSKVIDEAHIAKLLDTMSSEQLKRLADDYVHEEALYREAKALKLDQHDYVTRRRLIQQLEFLAQGFAAAERSLTQADISNYYEAHKTDYFELPRITFTHVFLNGETQRVEIEALAETILMRLNQEEVPFEQSMSYGDRFLYHVNYVASEADLIASHFGKAMRDRLFDLQPSKSVWRGPFRSEYGLHLVLMINRTQGYIPEFEEVQARVARDTLHAREQEYLHASLQGIVETYDVRLADDLIREIEAKSSGGTISTEEP